MTVVLAQGILYRSAGLVVPWKPFLLVFAIGAVLFGYALPRVRATIGTMVRDRRIRRPARD